MKYILLLLALCEATYASCDIIDLTSGTPSVVTCSYILGLVEYPESGYRICDDANATYPGTYQVKCIYTDGPLTGITGSVGSRGTGTCGDAGLCPASSYSSSSLISSSSGLSSSISSSSNISSNSISSASECTTPILGDLSKFTSRTISESTYFWVWGGGGTGVQKNCIARRGFMIAVETHLLVGYPIQNACDVDAYNACMTLCDATGQEATGYACNPSSSSVSGSSSSGGDGSSSSYNSSSSEIEISSSSSTEGNTRCYEGSRDEKCLPNICQVSSDGSDDSEDCTKSSEISLSDGEPVSISTGALYLNRHDIALAKLAFVHVSPYFNAHWNHFSSLGYGWNSILDVKLIPRQDGGWVLRNEFGQKEVFDNTGHNQSKKITSSNLEILTNGYLARISNDLSFEFDASGLLIRIAHRAEGAVRITYKQSEGKPSFSSRIGVSGNSYPKGIVGVVSGGYQMDSIINEQSSNDFLHIEYGAGGFVSGITDGTSRAVSYNYDSTGNLLKVGKTISQSASLYQHYKFGDSLVHQMKGFTSKWLDCLNCEQSKAWVNNQYDSLNRVRSQVYGGKVYHFDYAALVNGHNGTAVSIAGLDSAGNETSEKSTHHYTDRLLLARDGSIERALASYTDFSEPKLGGGLVNFTKTNIYVLDPQNHLKRELDERGRWVYYNRDTQGRIVDRYTVAGADTVLFLHKEYDPATGLESLRLEGGYKDTHDTIKTTYEYYSGTNAGLLKSEKVWKNATEYSEISYEYTSAGTLKKRVNMDGSIEEFTFSGSDAKYPTSKMLNGNVIETYVARDFAGRITQKKNAQGQTSTRTYDLLGRLTESCDYEGACTENQYEGRYLASTTRGKTATEPGITTHFVRDDLGHVIQEYALKANGTKVVTKATVFDADGNPVETRDAMHQTGTANETSVYSLEGNRQLQNTDAAGNSNYYQYDSIGNVVFTQDGSGNKSQNEYDHNGRLIYHANPKKAFEQWQFDSRGNPVYHRDMTGSNSYSVFDYLNHETIRIGSMNDTVYSEYDLKGHIIKRRSAEGVLDYYQYNAVGQLWRVVHKVNDVNQIPDSDDLIEQYTYDADGRQTMTRQGNLDSLITMSIRTYDGNGRVKTETNALGQITTYTYYGHGGIRSVVLPSGDSSTFAYDSFGRRTAEYFDGVLQSLTEYDLAGRLISRKSLGGDTLTYTYTVNNQVETVTDGENRVTHYEYDQFGKPSKVTDAAGKVTSTVHDALGLDSLSIDPMGNKTGWLYDSIGRPIVMSVNDTQRVNYYYPSQDFKVTVLYSNTAILEWRNRDGVLFHRSQGPDNVNYTFDSRGRVSSKVLQSGSDRDTVTYSYDLLGRFQSETGTNGVTTTYARDIVGRPTQTLQSVGGSNYTTSYTYDDTEHSTTLVLPSGTAVKSKLDTRGRIQASLINSDTVATYQWIGPQNSTRKLGNGITLSRTWDGSGREKYISYMKGAVNKLSLDYTRDVMGDIASVARSPWSNINESFVYRDDRQLGEQHLGDTATQWNLTGGLGYVASITRTAQDGGVNSETRTMHQFINTTDTIVSSNGDTITASNDYNMRIMDISGVQYKWNAEQQLVKAGDVSYLYDALGRVVRRALANGSYITYIYDGQQVAEEIHSDGTSKTFAWGTYIDEPVAVRTTPLYGVASTYYPLSGLNHNVEAVADAQGNLVERYKVEPYGAYSIWGAGADGVMGTSDDANYTQSAVGNNLVFQGRPFDADAGAYNFRARWYSPKLMKWMSNDPLLFGAGDVNLGRFVGNDPVNGVDPSGLYSETYTGGLSPTSGNMDVRARNYSQAQLTCNCDKNGKIDCSLWVSNIIVLNNENDPLWLSEHNDDYYELVGPEITDVKSRMEAALAHERDHNNLWKELFNRASTMIKSAESSFNKKCDGDCGKEKKKIETDFVDLKRRAECATAKFDDPNFYMINGLGKQYQSGAYWEPCL